MATANKIPPAPQPTATMQDPFLVSTGAPSPFTDFANMMPFSNDLGFRNLSPGIASARLHYTPLGSTPHMMTPFLVPPQPLAAAQQHQQSTVEASLNSKTVKAKGMQAASRLQSLEKPKTSNSTAGNGGSLGLVNNMNFYGGEAPSNPSSSNNHFMRSTNPLIAGGVSNQQQNNNGQPTPSGGGSGMLSGAFFESPMMNAGALTDFANHSRQMSPQMSTSFLTMSLPETPSGMKMGMDSMFSANSAQPNNNNLEKAKKTTSTLLNISRPSAQQDKIKQQQQTQQRVQTQQQQHESLFPPLEVRMSPPNPTASTNNNNNGQMSGTMPPPGQMTNMLRSSRLSANGLPEDYTDAGLADLGFVLSPMEMGRSLSGAPQMQMAESPMAQSLRLIQGYHAPPPSYASTMMGGSTSHPTWSLASIGQPPSTGFFAGTMGMEMPQQQQQTGYGDGYSNSHQLSMSNSRTIPSTSTNKKRRASDDSDDDDSSAGHSNKRKKKPAKPVDPNEPKITSKHRGVCWYKRTKKWVVQTKINGKRVHVGYFDNEEKAAEAYKTAVQSIQIKKALEAKQRAAEDMSKTGSL